MQRLLYRKMWRELRAAWPRYLALGLVIAFAMYMIVSLIGAADTVILGTARHAEANGIEDGQFTTFVPLTDDQEKALTDSGIQLEKEFFLDYALEDGSVLRVFRLREAIDRAELESGAFPGDDGVALEKRYCEENGLAPGDGIHIADLGLTVSGVCTSPDYDTPFREMGDSTVDSANFGTAFVTDALYEGLRATGEALRSEEYLYAYRLNGALTDDELRDRLEALSFDPERVEDPWFREYWDRNYGKRDELLDAADEMADGTRSLSDALDEMGDKAFGKPGTALWAMLPTELTDAIDGVHEAAEGAAVLRDAVVELADQYMRPDAANLRSFVTAQDNPRIGGAADDVVINKYASIVAGVIIMALLTYVISVFVVHNIESEQSVIGTLYALGVRRRELVRHYLLLPVMVALLSGIVGTALGYSSLGVPTQTADAYAYFSVPSLTTVVELPVILYGAVMPPLIAALVNLAFIRRRLSAPALQLIRKETKYAEVKKLDLGRMGYVRRFQVRQLIRESRSAVGVVLAIFICFLLMMIGLNAWVLCDHVGNDNATDTRYSHMYLYKYPEAEVPAGGHEAIALSMKKAILGYNMDVTVLGLAQDNPFFDAAPPESMSRVQISSAMAQKYGLKAGDVFTVEDAQSDRVYAFTADSVVRYSPAFYVFMDIDSLRELFDLPEDYYNVVFSDRDLGVDPGRLYSVSTREDVEKAANIFVELMWSMVITMLVASAAIMALVMYLMMKVMSDHAGGSIALFKLFGYRKRELGALFLNGNTLLIALGVLVSIPLSKRLMDAMYPYLVSNVPCAIDLRFEPWIYAALFVGCMLIYALIHAFLVRRICRIQPNEVLKNRE